MGHIEATRELAANSEVLWANVSDLGQLLSFHPDMGAQASDPIHHPNELGTAGGAVKFPADSMRIMRYLMLMWAEADAASGDEQDLQAWLDFDQQVKAEGAFVLNGALAPAATDARLVRTAIAGQPLDEAVECRPFAEGKRQIQAFYIMELPNMDAAVRWANKLPTYGYVEVRELLQF